LWRRSLACSPHSLQHVLNLAFRLREPLCIAGAQHHIRVGPVLWIEERIAPDRDPGLALAISPSCIPMSPSRVSARTVSENEVLLQLFGGQQRSSWRPTRLSRRDHAAALRTGI
jgi:hypothetical protein